MKNFGFVIVVTAGLLAPSVASAQVCVVAIIAKALYTSATENRELTRKEAMTCGLLVDEDERKALMAKDKKDKRAAKRN